MSNQILVELVREVCLNTRELETARVYGNESNS